MIGEGEQERVQVDGDFALPFNRICEEIGEYPVGAGMQFGSATAILLPNKWRLGWIRRLMPLIGEVSAPEISRLPRCPGLSTVPDVPSSLSAVPGDGPAIRLLRL